MQPWPFFARFPSGQVNPGDLTCFSISTVMSRRELFCVDLSNVEVIVE